MVLSCHLDWTCAGVIWFWEIGGSGASGWYGLTDSISAEKYFELIKERKVKGYLGQEKNYFGGEKA